MIDEAVEEHAREQYRIQRLTDLLDSDIRRPPWLFDGLLLDKTVTMISAEPFTGKTMLTLSMALALDAQLPMAGFKPGPQRHVLYLGQDAPTWDYIEMARKLARGYNLGERERGQLTTDFVLNEGVSLLDPNFFSMLKDWYHVAPFNVVMFDTLLEFHNLPENDNQMMGLVMRLLKRIRNTFGCAVMFTHHVSKPSADRPVSANYAARGASAIPGGIDFHLTLSHALGGKIRLRLPKGRGAARGAEGIELKLEELETPGGPALVIKRVPKEVKIAAAGA